MPLVLIILGLILLIAAVRGTHRELGELFKEQFTGAQSFWPWAVAIFMIALLGTSDTLRPVARAFLVLVLLVMFLVQSRNVNLFSLLQAQLLGRAVLQNAAPQLGRVIP